MYEGNPGEIDSVGSSDSARVELARVRGGGGGGKRGSPVTSSRTTILRFTIYGTNSYLFTIFKIRGRIKCQKRYVSPIL